MIIFSYIYTYHKSCSIFKFDYFQYVLQTKLYFTFKRFDQQNHFTNENRWILGNKNGNLTNLTTMEWRWLYYFSFPFFFMSINVHTQHLRIVLCLVCFLLIWCRIKNVLQPDVKLMYTKYLFKERCIFRSVG